MSLSVVLVLNVTCFHIQIAGLYSDMQQAETERANIRATLDAVEARQAVLLGQVDEYERVANDTMQTMNQTPARPADQQRAEM
jgi:predicted amidohydrolase YtcJ